MKLSGWMRGGVVVCASLFFLLAGCGRGEGWYDDARSRKAARDAYVEQQMDAGLSEVEAKRAWDADRMAGETTGSYRPLEVGGAEPKEGGGP